jgi:hypothetical protein
MTARDFARRPFLHAAFLVLGAGALTGLSSACTGGAEGTPPPTNTFYFPVGLAVSAGGNVLYAANSDFDLQFNGGTLQSYDLFRLRHDAAELVGADFSDPNCSPTAAGPCALFNELQSDIHSHRIVFQFPWQAGCLNATDVEITEPNGSRVPLGEACAPPVDSTSYVGDFAVIGAFATDIQLSNMSFQPLNANGTLEPSMARLFAPVRGDTTLTWADVPLDTPDMVPPQDAPMPGPAVVSSPFTISCGQDGEGRCDSVHHVGAVVDPEDTRDVTMPGEPFAMAQTPDGTGIAITHQTSQNTSLLLSGVETATADAQESGSVPMVPKVVDPSMQFVLTGVPTGGDGLVAVPHDLDAPVPPCEKVNDKMPCVRPAFLETTHSAAELDLLRYYDDDGSSINRPFLVREVAYTLTVNQGGTDSRGIVIDTTARLACEAASPSRAAAAACAQLPARVFFASRTPPSLVLGEIGLPSASGDGTFDPDRLVITGNVSLAAGASRVYLAPIVDRSGNYALRVFIVCYDSDQIFVYDPDAGVVENVIYVGPGPFAMAFDPFRMSDVASRAPVAVDPRVDPALSLKRYRFAYVASFTQSYLQVIDLDDSIGPLVPGGPAVSDYTFERVVFNLGTPTNPKGS